MGKVSKNAENERCVFWMALFGREKPEHANAPINTELLVFSIDVLAYSLRVKKIS